MTEDKHMQKARDIVDEACLGEPFAKNGVIAALTDTIATALSEAYRSGVEEERERCADIAGQAADGYSDCGQRLIARIIATAIRKP